MATYKDIKLNAIDENVEDESYISQIMKLAIAVPVGSLPYMEFFGSTVPQSVDAPMNAKHRAKVYTGAFDALRGLIPDTEVVRIIIEGDVTGLSSVRPVIKYKGNVL